MEPPPDDPPEDDPPDDDPPEEEVDPPEDVLEPPDEVDDPPEEDVLEPPLLVLPLVVPPELVDGSVPVPVWPGSVGFAVEPRSEDGLAKSSLSFAPPHAARRATEEATTAQRMRRGFMGVAKH